MTIVWSRRAMGHLAHLRAHIARDSPRAAGEVAEWILASVDLVAAHPEIGKPGRIAGTRELVIPRTPYVLVYRISNARLSIAAVFHGRQQWPERP